MITEVKVRVQFGDAGNVVSAPAQHNDGEWLLRLGGVVYQGDLADLRDLLTEALAQLPITPESIGLIP